VKRRIERSGFHIEQLARFQSNCLADSVAVLRTPLQSLEDEKIQGPLQYLDASLISRFHSGSSFTKLKASVRVLKT
jgi:hypothetical protein